MVRRSTRTKRAAEEVVEEKETIPRQVKRVTKKAGPSRVEKVKQGDAVEEEVLSAVGQVATAGSSLREDEIDEIKRKVDDILHRNEVDELYLYVLELEEDCRVGVASLASYARQMYLQATEQDRLGELMQYERAAIAEEEASALNSTKGKKGSRHPLSSVYLIGVDEVGVGPLAGPIVSCAAAFQSNTLIECYRLFIGINDSKKLAAKKREALAIILRKHCASFSFGIVTASEVDTFNPLEGSKVAMRRAVQSLDLPVDSSLHVFVDHHTIPDLDESIRQVAITKGDSKSIVIAAASILAKVYRDDYMKQLHIEYPHFGFDRNAGYGTSEHLAQLVKGVICPEHRLSYEPVRLAHRKSLGLPPEASPKKTRARTRSASPNKKTSILAKKPRIGDAQPLQTLHSTNTDTPSSIFSLTRWTNWFTAMSPSSFASRTQ